MTSAGVAWTLWRSARERSAQTPGYTAYMTVMVSLVTLAPIGRALWIVATDAPTASAIVAVASGGGIPIAVLASWALALSAGAVRGPVVMPPFLAHALATSPLPQRAAYARRIWTPVGLGAALGAAVAAVLCLAWGALGLASAVTVIAAVAAGVASGSVAAVLWLGGQACSPRLVAIASASLLGAAALVAATALPAGAALRPIVDGMWGSPFGAVALSAVAVGLVGLMPLLAARLRPGAVVTQSQRWASATAHAGTLDLAGSAATYQPLPRVGRRRHAIRGGSTLTAIVLRRDAVSATRTPERLAIGVLALVVGGAILAMAAASAPALSGLGAFAGVVAFAAAGAVTDGIRHVVVAASGPPLYGVGDLRMLAAHAAFPLLAALTAVLIGVVLSAIIGPVDFARGFAGIAPLAIGAILLRAMSALKPPMPIGLLAPMPTPAGDVSALARVAWALDAVLLAAAVGAAASLAAVTPLPAVIALTTVAAITAYRWRHR